MEEPSFETEKELNFYHQHRKAAREGKPIRTPMKYHDGPGWRVNPLHPAAISGRQDGEAERRGEDV